MQALRGDKQIPDVSGLGVRSLPGWGIPPCLLLQVPHDGVLWFTEKGPSQQIGPALVRLGLGPYQDWTLPWVRTPWFTCLVWWPFPAVATPVVPCFCPFRALLPAWLSSPMSHYPQDRTGPHWPPCPQATAFSLTPTHTPHPGPSHFQGHTRLVGGPPALCAPRCALPHGNRARGVMGPSTKAQGAWASCPGFLRGLSLSCLCPPTRTSGSCSWSGPSYWSSGFVPPRHFLCV